MGPRETGEGRAVRGSRGFTIVELLVVVAIIAILAGILLPVLIQAKDTARMNSCAYNMRQLGQAFRMYMDDNRGYLIPVPLPYPTATEPYPSDSILRPAPLLPYLKQAPVKVTDGNPKRSWVCPGDRSFGNEPPKWHVSQGSGSSYQYPYGAYVASRGHIDVFGGTTRPSTPRRAEQWAKPSRDLLLCDASASFHRGKKDSTSVGADNRVKCINFLMLDGHIAIGTRQDGVASEDITGGNSPINYLTYATIYDNPFSWGYEPTVQTQP